LEYDEIRISTRREISICRDAIRELEKTINGFAEKYGSPGTELPGDTGLSAVIIPADLTRWRDCCLALDRWKSRLEEHLRILNMQ
jgi:hypothetical protein